MLLAGFLASVAFALPQSPQAAKPSAADQLDAAEAAFWAALEDGGAPGLLDLGVERLRAFEGSAELEDPVLQTRLSRIRMDLESQRAVSHDTLRSNFPAFRLLRDGLRHEVLVDDPAEVATGRSAEALRDVLVTGWSRQAQYDVAVTARTRYADGKLLGAPVAREDLRNEAHYALAQSPRIWLDTGASSTSGGRPAAGRVALDVRFSDQGTLTPLWRMKGEAVLRDGGADVVRTVHTQGFALDRRDRLWQLGLLVALGALAACWWSRKSAEQLAVAGASWLVGIATVVAGLFLLRDWLPAPDALAVSGLWAVLVVAVLATWGPLVLVDVLPRKFGGSQGSLGKLRSNENDAERSALVGGSLPVLGAVLLESGWEAAAWATVGWWGCLLGVRLLESKSRAAPAWTHRAVGLSCAVGLAVLVERCPEADRSFAFVAWAAAGLGAAIGMMVYREWMLAVSLPLAAVAAMSSLPWLALVVGGVAAVAGLSAFALWKFREGEGATLPSLGGWRAARRSTERESADGAGLPGQLGDRLDHLGSRSVAFWPEGHDFVPPSRGAGWWVRDVVGVPNEFQLSLARHYASQLGIDIERNFIDLSAPGQDPHDVLRGLAGPNSPSLARWAAKAVGQTVVASGGGPAGHDELVLDLGRWAEDRSAGAVIFVPTDKPAEVGDLLESVARHLNSAARRERLTAAVHVVRFLERGGNGRQFRSGGPSWKSVSHLGTESEKLLEHFLVERVGLQAGLGTDVAIALSGLTPQECVEVLQRVVHMGKLERGARLPLRVSAEERSELDHALDVAKKAVKKGSLPELRDLTGLERNAALEVLELAAFVGSRFELRPICAALRLEVQSIAKLFAGLEDVVEDLEGDDEFRFRRLTDIEGLKRRGRVAPDDPDEAPRLRQGLRNDLAELVSAHAQRLDDGHPRRTESVGIVLTLAAAALEGGVPADQLAESVTAAANALGPLVGASLPGAGLMEGQLRHLLQSDGWTRDQRCALAVAQLRLEDRGIRTQHSLPHETAIEELGRVEGVREVESDRSADELRLQIAQRCAMHVSSKKAGNWLAASEQERPLTPLERVEAMLTRLIDCATASLIVRGRARVWRATIRYRTARQLQDAAAKLERVESTAEELRIAIAELRQETADVSLLPALQTQIEVFATLIDILPAEGGQAAWPSLLGEGREVGSEAVQLAERLRQHRVQRSLEGALGRLNQAAAVRHLGLSDQDAGRECLRVARDHFERNFDASDRSGDLIGMVLMPSSLVLCCYALGDVDDAREWCERYAQMLVDVRSEAERDGDPFLCLHRYALSGAPVGDRPHAEKAWSHEWIRPMRGVFRRIYSPSLDHISD